MGFAEQLESFDEVTSTMVVARQRAVQGASEGTTISARRQSAGRGRRGRSWFSPPGGLYLSTVLRPRAPSETLAQLALVAGLAVRAAVEEAGAASARLKWPNDVVVGRKKLAGVLVESLDTEVVLVGVGLNLLERGDVELPKDLSLRYIGLGDLVDGRPRPERITRSLLDGLELRYRLWCREGFGALRDELERYHALTGVEVEAQVADGWERGRVEGVDVDGALRIRTQNRVERVRTGEVRYLR